PRAQPAWDQMASNTVQPRAARARLQPARAVGSLHVQEDDQEDQYERDGKGDAHVDGDGGGVVVAGLAVVGVAAVLALDVGEHGGPQGAAPPRPAHFLDPVAAAPRTIDVVGHRFIPPSGTLAAPSDRAFRGRLAYATTARAAVKARLAPLSPALG